MSIFSYSKALYNTVVYSHSSRDDQLKIQNNRLENLLKYAKSNSEYYNKLIPNDLDFTKIKPINKDELLKNFDEIVTDKRLKLEDIKKEILSNPDGGSLFDGLYSVTMTSGSTGNPAIIVQDKNFQDSLSVVAFVRHLNGKFPIIMLEESDGYVVGGEMIKSNKAKSYLVKKNVHVVDITKTIDEIIKELLRIGPAVLISYTSTLTVLASKLIDSNTTIKEKAILISGEQCNESDRNIIKQAFKGSKVKTIYGCTEGGSMACECEYGHLHIAQDIVKLEPIDKDGNILPYDVKSDNVLLTNLLNYVQPIIRYELSDRITLHNGCPCGCKDDWVEIEGRSNDVIILNDVLIPSISISIVMDNASTSGLSNYKNYQMTISRNKYIVIKLDYYKDVNKDKVNEEVTNKLNELFNSYGITDITYEFEEGFPEITTRTGKRKRIIMKNE